ncbi:hypothetical protein, partial [Photobacterium halotolerans]|uniref:hypothetical protein n=1 Tax=Photobacterium halotolerans TaxID=265726 RepID=UPI001F194E90
IQDVDYDLGIVTEIVKNISARTISWDEGLIAGYYTFVNLLQNSRRQRFYSAITSGMMSL